MTINGDWVYTVERLELVAGSMGQLLAQIRPWISDRLVGGRRMADGCRDRKCSGGADELTTALAGLLEETEREDSLLRYVVGRKMPLEYNIDREPGGGRPDPGVFPNTVDDVLTGGGDRLREPNAVREAVACVRAAGRPTLPNAGKWSGSTGRCGRAHRSGPSARSRRGTGRCESR